MVQYIWACVTQFLFSFGKNVPTELIGLRKVKHVLFIYRILQDMHLQYHTSYSYQVPCHMTQMQTMFQVMELAVSILFLEQNRTDSWTYGKYTYKSESVLIRIILIYPEGLRL